MKKLFILLLGVLTVGLIIYAVPAYRQKAIQLLSYSACDSPLQYKLGTIDPKFGLTNDDVLQDIQQATNIWSSAEGKNLFTYSGNATFTVNFIYDQRAALNTQINQLKSQLSQSDTSLNQQIASYESQVQAFQQKLAAFNAQVDKYNQEGGAPPDVYKQLIKEQQDLNTQGNALNQMARQLNLSTNNYNYNVSVYNGDLSQFQQELALKPEEGLYNGSADTITIYFADNKQELIHTLSHEFGHSLGMEHVTDPHAIMYPYTTNFLLVTPDDMQQLSYVCREQSSIVHAIQVLDAWTITISQNFTQNFARQ